MAYQPAPARYDSIAYQRCGRSGLKLPAISLGLWHNFGGVDRLEDARAMLRRAFDLGITHFDLANNYGPPYGSAERNFGRILREDLAAYRDELIISSKAGWDMWPGPYVQGGGHRQYVLASLHHSRKRHRLDYVAGGIVNRPIAGAYLRDKMFRPGASERWDHTVERVTGEPLSVEYFARQFIHRSSATT